MQIDEDKNEQIQHEVESNRNQKIGQKGQDKSNKISMFNIQEYEMLGNDTIQADVTTNKKFCLLHFRITLILILFVFFLRLLPSPLIINIFENNPQNLNKQICDDQNCELLDQGYESITIKKVNPLNRQIKYYVRVNKRLITQLNNIPFPSKIDINKEITWVEIYAQRGNEVYGEVIYQKSGEDIYQTVFNGEPQIFMGEVHIVNEVSYIIKVYKKIFKYQLQNAPRYLEDLGNQTVKNNGTQNDNQSNPEIPPKQIKQMSIPLTVQIVRYSPFYTISELIIRYVTFLFILYVRAETQSCPKIFHIIILITSNPLIFTEIAFPNNASNIISTMCSSMYIWFVGAYLFYTHKMVQDSKFSQIILILKMVGIVALYISSIVSMLHLMNQTFILLLQYTLILLTLIPLAKYLWKIYFFSYKRVLHRDILLIVLTVYYFIVLFFSGYIVDYGWKKIVYYLIIQIYGVNLCYLTNKQKKTVNIQSQSNTQNNESLGNSSKIKEIKLHPEFKQSQTEKFSFVIAD